MSEKIWNRNFILVVLSNFLMHITYYAVISVLPVYLVSELNASKSQVGAVVAAYTLASVMIRPFTGFALDKFSRRLVFLFALLAYSCLFTGYLLAVSLSSLVILRFLQGLSWGFSTISSSTIAVDIIPATKRGEGIGYFGLSTTLGMSIGPVLGLFVCHHFGYIVMFVSGFAVSFAGLVCAWFMRLPRRLLVGRRIKFEAGNLFDRKSVRPSLNVMIIMTTYGGLISFVALFGREIGVRNTSLFFLLLSIGIATSRLLTGKAFDRNGPNRILTVCLILLAGAFPVLALVTNAAGYYVSALFIGFGLGVVFPTFQSMVNTLADVNHRGAANSTLYTFLDIGMGFGMLTSGLIAQHLSISAIFLISSLVCLAGLAFFRIVVLPFYEKEVAA
jgi:MFS family permease